MKKIILVAVAFLLTIPFVYAQEKFSIYRENQTSQHELGIEKFYFVHHTFADSFFMTELYKQLSYDEMALILRNVYDGVTEKEKVNVQFDIEKPADARIAYFLREHEENGKTFIMLTNFSNATRKFEPKPAQNDKLARWYFIRGSKLVYRKDLYTKEEEIKMKEGEAHKIIGFYLFDDILENDVFIKPLIDNLLESDENAINKFYARLYLSEYYLMQKDLENSKEAIDSLKAYYEENLEIPRTYALIVNMGTAEYEIMKRM